MQRYHDKLAQIDSRKLEVKGQRTKLSEEVKVLQAKVDNLNPDKKKATQEVQWAYFTYIVRIHCLTVFPYMYMYTCMIWVSGIEPHPSSILL